VAEKNNLLLTIANTSAIHWYFTVKLYMHV